MNDFKYDYILVNSKKFSNFLKKVKEKTEVNYHEGENDETLYVINTTIIGFSKYCSDLKTTHYFINEKFTYLLEEEKNE